MNCKLSSPNDCKIQLHKYALNKFINLLKPNSTLAEEAKKDFGFNFDKTIKSEWRDEFQEAAKIEVNESRVESLDSLCVYFILWMKDKILKENGYTGAIINEIVKLGDARSENFIEKLKELEDFLKENEIPNLKMAIIMMTSEEVTHEELIEYFEGGGKKRNKTVKKARGLSEKAKSFSLGKTKFIMSKKIKSAPGKISLSKLDKFDSIMVQRFVKLPKEKIRKVFKEVCEPAVKFFSKNMSIEDKEYRDILEKQVKKMKINNLLLLQDKKGLNNYDKNMKKRFPNISQSPKKSMSIAYSPKKSMSIAYSPKKSMSIANSQKKSISIANSPKKSISKASRTNKKKITSNKSLKTRS